MNERRRYLLFACFLMIPMLTWGCSHFYEGSFGSTFKEANDLFSQGNYKASLGKYEQIIEKYPAEGDRVLFEMGIIYAYPTNEQKDYQKALACFQKILKDYPGSRYRHESAQMISHITNVTIKETKIIGQQTQIATLEQDVKKKANEIIGQQTQIEGLEQEVKRKENEIMVLQKQIEALERDLKSALFTVGPISRILIEKRERRLSLIAKDKVLKSYRISLGGNPIGPKERKGDRKTPEGIYRIDGKNRDSSYHLSLRISYPGEKDKKRAKELGVPPGGNIMIHGLKNGFSWVGDYHADLDWTEGCIAVTDEEIEEIARVVPNGTIVEIRP